MSRIRRHLTYANVISTLCLFLLLGGGTAVALKGSNTVFSDDIVNGQVKGPDLRANSVGSGKIIDNGVKGTDIDESTLDTVPSADLGGVGRWTSKSGQGCDVGLNLFTCAFTTITLPQSTRVLLIGTAKIHDAAFSAQGQCLLATNLGDISDSATSFIVDNGANEHISLVATTTTGPGTVDFAIRCKETSGDAVIRDAAVAAVALSPH